MTAGGLCNCYEKLSLTTDPLWRQLKNETNPRRGAAPRKGWSLRMCAGQRHLEAGPPSQTLQDSCIRTRLAFVKPGDDTSIDHRSVRKDATTVDASASSRHAMAPPASHSALDELLSDTPLLSDAQSLFTQAAEKAAPEGTPHVPGPPNRPAAVWLPAPHTTSVGDRALDQRHGWTRAQHDQAWPFIGAAATSNAAGTGCCTADVVSILVDVPGDRGHLKATVGTVAEDRGHLRAAAVAAQSAAHSKKARAAWRPCYQSIMKVSSSTRHGWMVDWGR